MLLRKAAIIVLILLVLGTLGFGVWIHKSKNRLYSDPVAVRTSDLYRRAHASAASIPPIPTNIYSVIQVDRSDTSRVVVAYPETSFGHTETNFGTLHDVKADSSQVAKIGDGAVRLAYLGFAAAQPLTNFDWGLRVPAAYYTPDAKPLPPDRTNAPGVIPPYERELHFEGLFPSAQFVFATTNLGPVKTLQFSAFDARTHVRLEGGYSSSGLSNGFFFNSSIQLWHQTPVELLLMLAVGPIQSYTFPATEGTEIAYPGGQIRLLLKNEDDLGGWNSRHDGRSNVITFQIRPTHATVPPRKSCSFLFHSWPRAYSTPIEFEFLDAAGKILPGMRSSTSGSLMLAVAEATLDDVKEIRVKHYPNVYRISYIIPEIPGLPEQNRSIQNLFDVHIPYMYFRYEFEFQSVIGKLAQMDQRHLALKLPNNFFPMYRTNTTPRALLFELESLLANPELQIEADPQKNEIRTRLHPVRAAIEVIKKKLGI